MASTLRKTESNTSPFGRYRKYVAVLQEIAARSGADACWFEQATAALDGQASAELRRLSSLTTRRKFGAYFTGTQLSERLIEGCQLPGSRAIFYDPTCGAGDLLLAAAKRLPLGRTVSHTIAEWGERLAGTDLHQEFVDSAKARLLLLARKRHKSEEGIDHRLTEVFPNLRVADALQEMAAFRKASLVLMNPPYGIVRSPQDCPWSGGQFTAAAKFVIAALERVRPGIEVAAILPEVLRSGSFSERWRRRIAEMAEINAVETYGVFDPAADVDVFLLRVKRRPRGRDSKHPTWTSTAAVAGTTVGSYFNVHVGRVVPHRDPERGPKSPYVHPRCVPAWRTIREFEETRRFAGRLYKPPFVVIRRTSRPGHPYRATATTIAGTSAVAVENHLIVCEPKDRTLKRCSELMAILKSKKTNEYLDQRIRCRHLTVGSVASIPFSPD